VKLLPPAVPAEAAALTPFVDAGVFEPSEVHLAATFARLSPGVADEVLLGLALAARGPRLGHVCVQLDDVDRLVLDLGEDAAETLPWPDRERWATALAASPLVSAPADAAQEPVRPLVWDGRRLYLHRYWHHESTVAGRLAALAAAPSGPASSGAPLVEAGLDAALDAAFGPGSSGSRQRDAAEVALTRRLSVIAGGPGTGKTHTVARLLTAALALAEQRGDRLRVALAAPTGKAAARMTEAIRAAISAWSDGDGPVEAQIVEQLAAAEATTIHRLLGSRGGLRFQHGPHDPLPHDLIVIDETSMVSLPLMARLLEAVGTDARVVLVGDPFQLASVEAGSVMSDVVGSVAADAVPSGAGPSGPGPSGGGRRDGAVLSGAVTVLDRAYRFDEDSTIAQLADAIRDGRADTVLELLAAGRPDAAWVPDGDAAGVRALADELADAAAVVATAAREGRAAEGLAASTRIKLLAATRHRAFGLHDWTGRIEKGVAARVPGLRTRHRWYAGRPVIVTANDPANRLSNGDVGLVVETPDGPAVAFPTASADDEPGLRLVPPSRLDRVESWWAMTVHKSQGSEFDHAVVSLPGADSPILTRELLYTAVTRARARVTIVSSEEALRAAIERPIARASGLRDRLRGPADG